jgi:hypothetical protein
MSLISISVVYGKVPFLDEVIMHSSVGSHDIGKRAWFPLQVVSTGAWRKLFVMENLECKLLDRIEKTYLLNISQRRREVPLLLKVIIFVLVGGRCVGNDAPLRRK